MSLPSGASKCLVTFGPFTDHAGGPLSGKVTIAASTPIRHLATGQVLFTSPTTIRLSAAGTGSVELLHVDQSGFVDGSGGAITMWTYRAIIDLDSIEVDPIPFSFQVLVGQSIMDIGQFVPITPSTGTVIPQVVVLSVNGQTGAITVPSLNDLATVTNAAAAAHDLAQSATSTAQAAAGGLSITQGDLAVTTALVAAAIASAAANPDLIIVGTITRDSNGAATAADVVWPDGATGAYTGTPSSAVLGATDSYVITHVGSLATTTYTQPTVTRDASGAVIVRPAIVVT